LTIPASLALVPETAPDRYAVARAVLSRIPLGVAIIGAADRAERSCATGTAMYVSFSPPMIAIAEHPGSRTCRLIQRTGAFSVSFLHASQQDLAERGGHSGGDDPDKFALLRIPTVEAPKGASQVPAVAGSIAALWCTVRDSRESGDHILFTGEVIAHEVDRDKIDALLRFDRRYAHLGHRTSEESPEGYPT
jgi:flavin reductase (DIM6/NTAB) family NADH-FMN oxidoreductase RutF